MTEERKWENRSPAEQAVIEKLWQLKQAFKPYAAYCTAAQDLTLEHFTGRHSKTGPIMEPVSVKAGQTLRICMVSRLGDFGLTEKLDAETGYGLRVDWDSTLIRDVREQPWDASVAIAGLITSHCLNILTARLNVRRTSANAGNFVPHRHRQKARQTMTEQERDDTLVAVQTKNVLLAAANTELLRQLRVAERKAAALDWLEAHPDWTPWFHRPTQRWQCSPRVGHGGVHSGESPAAAIEAAMKAEETGQA